jgi:hypothetical protein
MCVMCQDLYNELPYSSSAGTSRPSAGYNVGRRAQVSPISGWSPDIQVKMQYTGTNTGLQVFKH